MNVLPILFVHSITKKNNVSALRIIPETQRVRAEFAHGPLRLRREVGVGGFGFCWF